MENYPTKESWNYKGFKVTSMWRNATSYNGLKPITQVYGVCFAKDNKILVIKDHDGRWTLPGGTPEKDEKPEKALKREIEEETSVEIIKPKMIGYYKVFFPNSDEKERIFYQLRYAALISKIKKLMPDPATGKVREIKFIRPEKFNNYIKWGKVGKEMFRIAHRYFKKESLVKYRAD